MGRAACGAPNSSLREPRGSGGRQGLRGPRDRGLNRCGDKLGRRLLCDRVTSLRVADEFASSSFKARNGSSRRELVRRSQRLQHDAA